MRDRTSIYAAAFLRALATGMAGVLLGIHLARLGFDPAAIGTVVGAGLAGAALAALAATIGADRLGRRRALIALAVLGAAGGLAFAASTSFLALGATAFAGMLNGMGRDRGAALIIEQAMLPSTTTDSGRTRAFAWYNVLQDAGHALGGLLAAAPGAVRALAGFEPEGAMRGTFAVYSLLVLATGLAYLRLTPAVEAIRSGGGPGGSRAGSAEAASGLAAGACGKETEAGAESASGSDAGHGRPPGGSAHAPHGLESDVPRSVAAGGTTPDRPSASASELRARESAVRSVLWKISSLFALDSLGGGFLTTALLSLFFFERFGAAEAEIGLLFFGARLLNAASHLAAAWLAQRIGLVNTMVFTHVPSSLLLMTVAVAPNFPIAAILFLLREGLVEMDVPTRQSYVMAVVRPAERTLASGVTHVVRLAAWAIAPAFAGLFMKSLSLGTPLFIGAVMKIVYDGLLYAAFRRLKPPEERLTESLGQRIGEESQ